MYILLLCFFILLLCCTNKIPSTISSTFRAAPSCRFGLDWTTFFKAILPFCIIIHHIDHNFNLIFPDGISRIGLIIVGNFGILGAIVVGVFFFISGYGLTSSFLKKGDAYFKGFFRKRFVKLLVPFIFVSTIEQIVRTQVIQDYNVLQSFWDFLCKGDFFVQWFVCVLLIFYVFFYLCFKYIKDNKKAALMLLLCVCVLSLFYLLAYTVPYSTPDDIVCEHWWKSNLCFVIGVFYCMYESTITQKLNGKWKFVVSGLAILIAVLTIIQRVMPQIDTIKLVILIMPIFLTMISYFFNAPKGRLVEFFSRISYETFLVHSIVLTLFMYVFRLSSEFLTFFVIFVSTYVFAWITKMVCKKINDLLK